MWTEMGSHPIPHNIYIDDVLPAFNIGLIFHCIDSSWIRSCFVLNCISRSSYLLTVAHPLFIAFQFSIHIWTANRHPLSQQIDSFLITKASAAAAYPAVHWYANIPHKFQAHGFKYLAQTLSNGPVKLY